MPEPFPPSFYAVWSNPLPGRETDLHAWYEDVHIPDSLEAGLFDSVLRYRALDETSARYLTLWGCRYASEDEALAAVRAPDFDVIMGLVLFGSTLFVLANILVDISYALIDPRVRVGSARG